MNVQVISEDSTHASVQNLRGWSVSGTVVLRLRKGGLVTGDPITLIDATNQQQMLPDVLDADGGCYVEVVSGALTEGYLYYT